MILAGYKKIIYNYSEEHQCYLWTPPKTGSNHATFLFNHFSFYSKIYREFDKVLLYDHNQKVFTHCHQYIMLPEHSNYKIICTARTPFASLYSFYKHVKKFNWAYKIGDLSFKDFIQNNTEPESTENLEVIRLHNFLFSEILQQKIPNYFVRVEHLYEDYLKIPFINGSKLHTSGILEEICSNKINVGDTPSNFSDYLDQDLQDYISTKYSNYFDLLGYSKTVL
jgi:hypothetical protein